MTKQYWVNDNLIDLTRNQIKRYEQVESLQPKALAVLTTLAKHAGQVVSHDTLMAEVWGNSVVAPNSLQRCIVQLRKALGDDGKTQALIKTHARQGYSLEAEIKWSDSDRQSDVRKRSYWLLPHWLLLVVCGFILLLFAAMGFWLLEPGPVYNNITPMTASDEREFNGNYSPDGRYLVFHRYLGLCKNHLWAKDLQTQQEVRLTKTAGIYSWHEWSVDGNQLVFTLQENCHKDTNDDMSREEVCWHLQTLDFAAALQAPQAPQQRLDCDQEQIKNPQWLNDGNIAMLKYQGRKAKLVHYDVRSDTLGDFYQSANNQIYSFEYIPGRNSYAVVSLTPEGEHLLELLNSNGEQLSQHIIQRTSQESHFQYYYINLHPDEKSLVVNTDQFLYYLSFSGELRKINVPNFYNLHQASFHPNGNKLVATQGMIDIDIAKVNLSSSELMQNNVKFNQVYTPYPSIARSIVEDYDAQFQPGGTLIAFISKRSGSEQLWLYNDDGNSKQPKQLSGFAPGLRVNSFGWSPSGDQIAVAVNDGIVFLSLNGEMTTIDLGIPIENLYQWVNQQQLLVDTGDMDGRVLLFDLHSKVLTDTGISDVLWAQISSHGDLIFVDQKMKLWRQNKNQTQMTSESLLPLNGKKFVLRNGSLYGINGNHQLYVYQLEEKQLTIIKELDERAWRLTDMKDQYALITQGISARKEIVEVSR